MTAIPVSDPLSPAEWLLRQAALIDPPKDEVHAAGELSRDPGSLTEITNRAHAHGMRPLLFRYLNSAGAGIPTGSDSAPLAGFLSSNLRRNLMMTGELLRILKAFDSQAIDVLPYKGPVLAELAYGSLGMREFGDLDLLIRSSDLPAAIRLMAELGYRSSPSITDSRSSLFSRYCNVLAFTDSDSRTVELHWALSPAYLPFDKPIDSLLARATVVMTGGRPVKTLSPEDLLLYLCFHGTKHRWERLSWICDIGHLLDRHPHLDWAYLLAEARRLDAERLLATTLNLALLVTRVTLNPLAEQLRLHDRAAIHLATQLLDDLFLRPPSLPATTTFILRVLSHPSARTRCIFRIIFTPSAADWISSPSLYPLNHLLPLVRPLRLLASLFHLVPSHH